MINAIPQGQMRYSAYQDIAVILMDQKSDTQEFIQMIWSIFPLDERDVVRKSIVVALSKCVWSEKTRQFMRKLIGDISDPAIKEAAIGCVINFGKSFMKPENIAFVDELVSLVSNTSLRERLLQDVQDARQSVSLSRRDFIFYRNNPKAIINIKLPRYSYKTIPEIVRDRLCMSFLEQGAESKVAIVLAEGVVKELSIKPKTLLELAMNFTLISENIEQYMDVPPEYTDVTEILKISRAASRGLIDVARISMDIEQEALSVMV